MDDIEDKLSIISKSPKIFEPEMDGVECLEPSCSKDKIAITNDSLVSYNELSTNVCLIFFLCLTFFITLLVFIVLIVFTRSIENCLLKPVL